MPLPDGVWWTDQLDTLMLPSAPWKSHPIRGCWPSRTYTIAEVGASWITPLRNPGTGASMTPLEAAKAFVWMARYRGHHDAGKGANAVKFQYWSDSDKLAGKRRMPEFADRYERSRLPANFLPLLAKEAASIGMDFICTTYMMEDIAAVAPYVRAFKIASFEVLDVPFIEAHLPYDKPIYLSTGLTTAAELGRLLWLRKNLGRERLKLLLCTSAYPCPYGQVNLQAIRHYDLDGLSDHTGHPMTGALAVCAGARTIEMHIRSEFTRDDNPDYPHALAPDDFDAYLTNIDLAEELLGDGEKVTMPAEAANRQYMA